MKFKEKDIENDILVWLNLQPNVFAFKVNTGGFYDTKRKVFRKNLSKFIMQGTADILGSVHGRFLALEVKTPTTIRRFLNYPTEADKRQQLFLNAIKQTGGIAQVVCSLDDVMRLLQTKV